MPAALTIRGAFPVFKYQQIDAEITGVDFFGKIQVMKKWNWITKASLVRGKNQSNNEYLVQFPSDRIENEVEYSLVENDNIKNTAVSISLLSVMKQTRVPVNTDYAPAPNGYHLIGINANTTIYLKKQPITLGLRINNLTNQGYRDYMNRFRYYSNDLGRNISCRVSIPF